MPLRAIARGFYITLTRTVLRISACEYARWEGRWINDLASWKWYLALGSKELLKNSLVAHSARFYSHLRGRV